MGSNYTGIEKPPPLHGRAVAAVNKKPHRQEAKLSDKAPWSYSFSSSRAAARRIRSVAGDFLFAIMFLVLWGWSFDLLAARPPESQQARSLVLALEKAVVSGHLEEDDYYQYFQRPRYSSRGADGVDRFDLLRLASALKPDGYLRRSLAGEPDVLGTVTGPGYVRVVMGTKPYLSFIVEGKGSHVRVARWESTSCVDCREPIRFVEDLVVDIKSRNEPRLLPGLDLLVEGESRDPQYHDQQGSPSGQPLVWPDWYLAFQLRNQCAGYLAWLLDGAEVLGADIGGVRVALRSGVETWPVLYSDGRWQLDYRGLAPDSSLRLDPAQARRWRDLEYVRSRALEWWLAPGVRQADGSRLLARKAVAIGFDPIRELWMLVLERPDSRIAALVGLDQDARVLSREALPPWPAHYPAPGPDWVSAWTAAWTDDSRKLLLGAAGRWWVVDTRGGDSRPGPRGLLGDLVRAAWSPGGRFLALGDGDGRVALVDASTLEPLKVHYRRDGEGAAVVGLLFDAGEGWLLVAWADGRLEKLSIPHLEPVGILGEAICCGEALGLSSIQRGGWALLACGNACEPLSLARVSTLGDAGWRQVADARLRGAPFISASPDGIWVVMASPGPMGTAVLCQAESMEPVAFFGRQTLMDVAWNTESSAFVTLSHDGRVLGWTIADLVP